jgi:peptidoglycan hydrolase-like protein with peptidoglycan-binding domain/GH24 family phage-related lysozyme (muramidase)
MTKLVSRQCVDFVKSFEGFSPTVYDDGTGVMTLGYGMTGSEIEGISSVTEEQATEMLEDLLDNRYAAPIKNDLDSRGIKLNQNQFDALVSMAYNIGTGGLLGSTLYRQICEGITDEDILTADFCMWDKAGGKVLPGLLRRRKAEATMFFGKSGTDTSVEETPEEKGKEFIGSRCAELQTKLKELGYDVGEIDGIFGDKTYNALTNFQKYSKLTVDGLCGEKTWEEIEKDLKAKGIKEDTQPITPTKDNSISNLQTNLNGLINAGLTVDGIQGEKTTEAIKSFQKIMGLNEDGIFGTKTSEAIAEILSCPLDGVPYPHYEYATRWIQWRVGADIDGTFGNGTAQAVMNFQQEIRTKYEANLSVDGIVGGQTWLCMFKY